MKGTLSEDMKCSIFIKAFWDAVSRVVCRLFKNSYDARRFEKSTRYLVQLFRCTVVQMYSCSVEPTHKVERLIWHDPIPDDGDEEGSKAGEDESLFHHLLHLPVPHLHQDAVFHFIQSLFFLTGSSFHSELLGEKRDNAAQPSPPPCLSDHPGQPLVDHSLWKGFFLRTWLW